jgi:hypothetical protein
MDAIKEDQKFEVLFKRDGLMLEKRGHNPLDLNSMKDLELEQISFTNNSEGVFESIIFDYKPAHVIA